MKNIIIPLVGVLLLVSCVTQKSRYEYSTFGKIYHNTTARYNGYFNATVLLEESIANLNQAHVDNYHEILPLYPYSAVDNAGGVAQNMDEAIKKVSVVVTLHEQSQWVDDCYLLIGQAEYVKQDYEAAENAFEFFLDEFNPSGKRVDAKPSRKLKKARKKAASSRRGSRTANDSRANVDSKEDKKEEARAEKTRKQLEKERKAYNKALKKKRKQAKKNKGKSRRKNAPDLKKEPEQESKKADQSPTKEESKAVKPEPEKTEEEKDTKKQDSQPVNENPGGLKHKPAYQKVVLWLARTYVKRENYLRAEYYLFSLEKNAQLQEEVYEELPVAFAELYLARKMYPKAISALQQAVERAKRKDTKARYTYILGQLYQETKNYQAAKEAFEAVIDYKPDYTMVFNARIQALQSAMQSGNISEEETLATLERMLKDDKNIEFVDQVYYALAQLVYNEGDIDKAILYLKRAVENGNNNREQLAESNYMLGNIYFEQADYVNAKTAYDAAVGAMSQSDPRYLPTKRLADNLTAIAEHLETIALQDSLLRISAMSEDERKELAKEIRKQRELAAAANPSPGETTKRLGGKKGQDQDVMASRSASGTGIPLSAKNNNPASGGNKESNFFAYDPKALKRGIREFEDQWGDRRLGDNWRVSSIAQNNLSFDEEDTNADNDIGTPIATSEIEDIFKDVPETDAQITEAHRKIQDAMIALGQLYREKLEDYDASIAILEELLRTYPTTTHKLEAYYQLYISHTVKGQFDQAGIYKQKIISEYPGSKYAQALENPNYVKEQLSEAQRISELYDKAYLAFDSGDAQQAKELVNQARQQYGTQHDMYPKFHLLYAMAMGSTDGRDAYVNELKQIVAQHPKTPEETKARDILLLLGETKDTRLTQGSRAEADFRIQPDALHFVVVMIEDPTTISAQDAKISISDYHKKYHSLDKLRMSSLVFDPSSRSFLILIRSFKNQSEAMMYYANFLKNKKDYLPEGVPFRIYPVTQHNYREVIKLRSLDEYGTFFEQNY